MIAFACWGCGLWRPPTALELVARARLEAQGGRAVVLGGEEAAVLTLQQYGSPSWGVPWHLQVRVVTAVADTVVEIPGRWWAICAAESVGHVLVSRADGLWWYAIGKAGEVLQRWHAQSLPGRTAVVSVALLGRRWWVARGGEELWLYDRQADRWQILGQAVIAVAQGGGRVAWVQRSGGRLSVQWLGAGGEPLWVASAPDGERVRCWVLERGEVALAVERGKETWVRLWYSDGGLGQEWRSPRPVEQVAVGETPEGPVLYWLQRSNGRWELWQRGTRGERLVASVSTTTAEASVQTAGEWWLLTAGTRLVLGNRHGIQGEGRGAETFSSLVEALWIGPSALALFSEHGAQLYEVVPTPLRRWLTFWGVWVLLGSTATVGLLGGGKYAWRWIQRRAVRGLLRRSGIPAVLVSRGLQGTLRPVFGAWEMPSVHSQQLQELATPWLFQSSDRWWVWFPLGSELRCGLELTEAIHERQLELASTLVHELRDTLRRLGDMLKHGATEAAQQTVHRLWELTESARKLVVSAPIKEWVPLEELWHRLREEHAPLEAEGIVQWHPLLPALKIWGDAEWLLHALRNGIANAVQALRDPKTGTWRPDARIEVRAWFATGRNGIAGILPGTQQRSARYVVIEIRDNGQGISGGLREGLGMRIISAIARAHGGVAQWESPPQASGTCLRLCIPVPR